MNMARAPDLKKETQWNARKHNKRRNGKCIVLLRSSIETLYVSEEFLSGIEFGFIRMQSW